MIHDNAIEFYTESKRATVTLHSPRLRNRVLRLAEESDEVEIVATNVDGSILAHIPVKWLKIVPPRVMSEEQLEQLKRMRAKLSEAEKQKRANRGENDSDDKIPD